MKTPHLSFFVFFLSSFVVRGAELSHHGHVAVNGAPFNGSGLFKFALLNDLGTIVWNHQDGTSNAEPAQELAILVTNGFYSVNLGDESVTGMTALPATLFNDNAALKLRVWFNDGSNGSFALTPDQKLSATPYSFTAEIAKNVPTLKAELDALDVKLTEVNATSVSNLEAVQVLISGLDATLTLAVENNATNLQGIITANTGNISALQNRITELETELNATKTRVAYLESSNNLVLTLARPMATLGYKILPNAMLWDLDLSDRNFTSAIWYGVDLNSSGTKLIRANFTSASMYDSNFTLADATSAVFVDSDLNRSDFRKSTFVNADMSQADMNGTNFTDANFTRATFVGSDLQGAILTGGSFTDANFKQANLANAVMNAADFNGTDFSNSRLTSTNLSSSWFGESNFSDSNLTDGNFTGAKLHGVDMNSSGSAKTIVTNAIFSEVEFKNAILDGVDLGGSQAILSGTSGVLIDHSGASLIGADLLGVNLTYANLQNANLNGAKNLSDVNLLKGADISGAILTGTGITQAIVDAQRSAAAAADDIVYDGATIW